jgi:tetratricopeptide (TPR) repeat protein
VDSQADVEPTVEFTIEEHSGEPGQDVKEPESQMENRGQPDDPDEVGSLRLSPVAGGGLFVEDMEEDDSSMQDQSDTNLSTTGSSPIVEIEQTATIDRPELEIGDTTIAGKFSVSDQMVEPIPLRADDSVENATDLTESSPYELEDTITAEAVVAEQTLSEATGEHLYSSTIVSAEQLAEDIGADAPTPVAAQTVFTATSTEDKNQIFQWGVFATLCLVIAVSLSFFIFNYTVPIERPIKSPLAARGIETQPEPGPAIEIPEDLVFAEELDSEMFTGQVSDVIERENAAITGGLEKPVIDNVLEAGAEGVAISESEQEGVTGDSVTTVDQAEEEIWYPADDISAEEYATKENIVEELAMSLPEKIMPEPELIKISRSKSVDKGSMLVNKAYEEYLAGDFDSAEKNYQLVLENLPGNRDALLGLAAISLHKGDVRQAYTYYLEVLRLYPGDSVAEAALINFNDNTGNTRSESILKIFLQSEPDNSFLHYSLARLFAAQTRWPEAQLSFFDAHRLESSNADYAFNLAVSLEHIGQQQSAIDYYNVALELVDNSVVDFAASGFDRAVAISRINALSNQAN